MFCAVYSSNWQVWRQSFLKNFLPITQQNIYFPGMEANYGYRFYFAAADGRFLFRQRWLDHRLKQAVRSRIMIWLYGFSAFLALFLLIYLFVALIKPEWF
jgi:K+-transporting ATPase KdpF subunit